MSKRRMKATKCGQRQRALATAMEFFDGLTKSRPEPKAEAGRSTKTRLVSLLDELKGKGWTPRLTERSYENIIAAGLRGKNLPLAGVATEIAYDEKPLTLRGLMYRVVSAGWLPSTEKKQYSRLGRILTTLRERGVVPFSWIVDNVRSTIKPSSWSGLGDFVDTVQSAYRKNFWASLP